MYTIEERISVNTYTKETNFFQVIFISVEITQNIAN